MAVARRRARSLLPWVVLGILAFTLSSPAGAFAAADPSQRTSLTPASPGDRAATHTLLTAEYELEKATLARAGAVDTTLRRAAEALGHECKDVLRGAPEESVLEAEGPSAPRPRRSGRAQGERARSEQEKQTIDLEIEETIYATADRVLRVPIEAFIARANRLTWSDPTINALVQQKTGQLQEHLIGPPIAACAEMRAWAASGFHLLPPGSRSLNEAKEARSKEVLQGNLEALLRPYENSAERATVRRTRRLKEQLTEVERADEGFSPAELHMDLALGEKLPGFAEQQLAPVVGKGRTSAGTTFVIRASVGSSFGASCKREVDVEFRERGGGHGSGLCLSEGAYSHPSGSCSGPLETVELATPPNVRSARVRLSNGRTITASVLRVPAKDGGPAGVFIDAFHGYTPYPVSVQELSGAGVLRTLSLSRMRCTKEPAAGAPGLPQIVNLATFTDSFGEILTISATLHRFRGQTEFFLEPQPGPRSSQSAEEHGMHKQFPWDLSTECAPHSYSLLDGILVPPGASVLARIPAGLTPLTKVELAASMHAGGPLFYGVYATPPTEIVVERSNGSVLYTESLAAKATEETEFCEGYVER